MFSHSFLSFPPVAPRLRIVDWSLQRLNRYPPKATKTAGHVHEHTTMGMPASETAKRLSISFRIAYQYKSPIDRPPRWASVNPFRRVFSFPSGELAGMKCSIPPFPIVTHRLHGHRSSFTCSHPIAGWKTSGYTISRVLTTLPNPPQPASHILESWDVAPAHPTCASYPVPRGSGLGTLELGSGFSPMANLKGHRPS